MIKNIESCEIKDAKGNVIMQFNNNPSVTFTLDEIGSVLDEVKPVQPRASAREAGEALRKAFISLTEANGEFKKASDVLSELADKWSEIGNINPITPDEVAQGLLRAQTPDTTVTPNENEVYNFLEQNAYDEDFHI